MGKRIPPSVRLEQEVFSGMATSGDPLGEAARRGAQLLLQKALEMEVTEFLGRGHYERGADGSVLGYRNGYEPKKVHMAEGTIDLQVPQLRETLEPFDLPVGRQGRSGSVPSRSGRRGCWS